MDFLLGKNLDSCEFQLNHKKAKEINEKSINFHFQEFEGINIGGNKKENVEKLVKDEEEDRKMIYRNAKHNYNNDLDILEENKFSSNKLEVKQFKRTPLQFGEETACSKNKQKLKENDTNIKEITQLNKHLPKHNKNTFSIGIQMYGLENLQIRTCPKSPSKSKSIPNLRTNAFNQNKKHDFINGHSLKNMKINLIHKLDFQKLANHYYSNKKYLNNSNLEISISSNSFHKKRHKAKNEINDIRANLRDTKGQFPKERNLKENKKSIHYSKYN